MRDGDGIMGPTWKRSYLARISDRVTTEVRDGEGWEGDYGHSFEKAGDIEQPN